MKINNVSTTIILFASGCLIIFFSVIPRYQEYTYLESQLSEIQSQYANELGYYKDLADAVSKIESNQDFIKKVNTALPETDSTSEIINFVQNKSAESDLGLQSMSFSKVSKATNSNVKYIYFTIELHGKYDNFKKFVHSLDASSRIFQIVSISFESQTFYQASSQSDQSEKYYKMEVMTHSY